MKKLILPVLLNLLAFGVVFGQVSRAPTIVNQPTTEVKKAPPFNPADLIGIKGQTAPPFALPAMDGTEYNLDAMRGKIVVVNLWGTFCPPCITEMPELNALVEKYKDKEVVFLAPAPDDKSALEGFLQKHPFNYRVLPNAFTVIGKYAPHKKSDEPQKKGGFMMILPTHLVIDQTGLVTYHEWGFRKDTAEKLSGEIERLLTKNNAK
jgi:peroxiredoxin